MYGCTWEPEPPRNHLYIYHLAAACLRCLTTLKLSQIITFLVCGCVGRGRDWDPWSETFDSLNNDVVSNCDDCLYLKWTDGLRSRWVPAGTSYPESTKSCVLGIIEDILSFIWYHSPVLKDAAVNKSSYFPFIKKTFNIKIHCLPLQCRTCSQ